MNSIQLPPNLAHLTPKMVDPHLLRGEQDLYEGFLRSLKKKDPLDK